MFDPKSVLNADGTSAHDGGLYACGSCEEPINYWTWSLNDGLCYDCGE